MAETAHMVLDIIRRLGLNRGSYNTTALKGGPYTGCPHHWYVGKVIVLPWKPACWAVYVVAERPPVGCEAPKSRHIGAAVFKGFATSEKKGLGEVVGHDG